MNQDLSDVFKNVVKNRAVIAHLSFVVEARMFALGING